MRPLPPGFTRLESGAIRWRVQVNGRRRTGSAPSLAEAKQARAAALVAGGGDPARVPSPPVGELLAVFLDQHDVAPVTAQANRRACKLLPAEFAARDISTVTPVHVSALWRQLADGGANVHMTHRFGGVLSKAWQWAATFGWVTSNPFQLAPPPTPPPADEINPPTIEQVRALIDHFGQHPLALAVRIASVTGARRGEVVALQWDDVRLDQGEIIIRRSLSQTNNGSDIHIGETKTGRRGHRNIPLDAGTVRAIRAHATSHRIVGCPWIFTHDGRTPWTPSYITRAVGRAVDDLELDFSFHGLRHFAATEWLSAGVPPSTAAGLLGHTTTNTLHRTYAHWIPAQGRDVINAHAARLDA